MGILILRYTSQVLQALSFILWFGGLLSLFIILNMNRNLTNLDDKFSFKISLIYRIGYFVLLGGAFFWSSVLLHFLSTFNNPLKSRAYLLFLILAFALTILTVVQFVMGIKIFNLDKKRVLYEKTELVNQLIPKQMELFDTYFFVNLINLILASFIILLNQP